MRESTDIIRIAGRNLHGVAVVECHADEVVAVEFRQGFHGRHTSWAPTAPGSRVLLHQRFVLWKGGDVGHRAGGGGLVVLVSLAIDLGDGEADVVCAGLLHGRHGGFHGCRAAVVLACHLDVGRLLHDGVCNGYGIGDFRDGLDAVVEYREGY